MIRAHSFWVSLLYVLGLVLVFAGERVLGTGNGRLVLSLLGVFCVVGAGAWRGARQSASSGEVRRSERLFFWMYLVGTLALLIYFGQSDLVSRWLGRAMDQRVPRLSGAMAAAWPVLIASALLAILFGELVYASMARAPVLEFGRVRSAAMSGLGLAGALVFAFASTYVASERDHKFDLSYARTAKPGDSTRKIVRGLDAPVQVALFFPPANEVREQVLEYFTDLARESPQLKIQSFDKDVDVAKAKELNVSGNGAAVLSRGARKEQLVLGQRLESARSELSNLDQEVQKRLLAVARAKRTVYFTTGHGERSDISGLATDQRASIANFKELLRSQNEETRNLGAAEGLASEVPRDAGAVLVLGPTHPFLSEELSALSRYIDSGGRALFALDPDSGVDMKGVLEPLGVKVSPVTLANDKAYLARTHQKSDRSIIFTASFSSHPSVTSLSQLGPRVALVLLGAGALEPVQPRPAGLTLDFTVHAHPLTWDDKNGNLEFDPPQEVRKSWELVAAIAKRKAGSSKDEDNARVLVVGDSDLFTDVVLGNPGNSYFALDGARWLMGEDSIAGVVNSEVDRPIEHTRNQDKFWFYSTIFLAPALVLGIGLFSTRSRRAKRPAKAAPRAERS